MTPGRRWHLVGLAIVVAACASAETGVSPGRLARDHAALESSCDQCHASFAGIPDQNCLACHQTLATRIAAGDGFHASVGDAPCVSCHSDHRGRNHTLSPSVGAKFDHGKTAFALRGRHRALACTQCHPRTRTEQRLQWAGIRRDCAGCHPDSTHRGRFGARCDSCHREAGWLPVTRLHSDHEVGMAGKHGTIGCDGCHQRGRALASDLGCAGCHDDQHGDSAGRCADCHTTASWGQVKFDHSFWSLPGKHATAPCRSCHGTGKLAAAPRECAGCHDGDRRHESLGPCARCHSPTTWRISRFAHDRKSDFDLTGRHADVTCERCHTRRNRFRIERADCASCHKVPKHGDFGGCDKCHDTTTFARSSFDHDRTRMPIRNAHVGVACQKCHARLEPGSYVPGPNSCGLCHSDPHDGQFSRKTAALGDEKVSADHHSAGRTCLDCHTPDRWKPSTVDAVIHDDFAFPLRGRHETVGCASCHPGGSFVGTSDACRSCHADRRHRGQLGTRCERCHTESGWTRVARFDHGKDVGFALDNGHRQVACARCHASDGKRPSAAARAGATRPDQRCAACHRSTHGPQFGNRCTRCHNTASFASTPRFDHARETGFRLERRHRAVACAACHDVRKRPRAVAACQSCHDDPHRASNGIDCSDCHRPDRWRIIRFDHDRTEFPLIGRHFTAGCGGCHVNPGWTGVRGECIACHAMDRPRTQDHVGQVACQECHTPVSWRLIR